jgi:agmatine/peptidylarginine deiminase
VKELKRSFLDVQIVEVANHIPNTTWDNFTSAYNCFVSSIVMNNYIYMPTFNDGHDAEMLELFKLHTNKTFVPISTENVAKMGGSVRCLSWQVNNANKRKILQLLKQ